MKSRFLSIAIVLVAVSAAAGSAMAASAKPKQSRQGQQKAPSPVTRPAEQDQSYLFLNGPRTGRGTPDYITSGMNHFNQPWFMTQYDWLGDWR